MVSHEGHKIISDTVISTMKTLNTELVVTELFRTFCSEFIISLPSEFLTKVIACLF